MGNIYDTSKINPLKCVSEPLGMSAVLTSSLARGPKVHFSGLARLMHSHESKVYNDYGAYKGNTWVGFPMQID